MEIPPAKMPSQMSAAGIEINDCELDIVSADGEVRHVLGNARPLRDAQGNPHGSISAFIDITERKKAEEALRFSNLYNRSLIEASLDPLVTIGRDGKIKDVNNATEQVTGYSRNHLTGTDFSDYFTEPEKARKGYQQVFTEGEVRDYPLEIQHKDGHITPVLYNASVYKDEDGKVVGVFAAARDTTELKKAEEALKKEHDNLEKLVEERTKQLEKAYYLLKESENGLAEAQKMAHIGNWEWDIAAERAYWSAEMYRIFRRDSQESPLSYNEYLSYIHPDDRDCFENAAKKAMNGIPCSIDHRIVLPNGEARTVHVQSEVIFDDRSIPVRIKGIIQDITERKETEKALLELEITRKKEIHHRIKNNLQVISSLLDLQAENLSNRKCIKDSDLLNAFKESQNRIMSIALIHEELHEGGGDNTLNFSLYLERLVKNLFQTYRLGSISICLDIDLEENIFFDMDTAVPLGIIVNELVSNSLEHAFPDRNIGEIRIKLFKEEKSGKELSNEEEEPSGKDNRYILIVSDNGVGISEEINLEKSNTLGLQLVNTLVDQLDGEIELKTDAGTEFVIKINV
jgi:PAS domain S-box-containing protein